VLLEEAKISNCWYRNYGYKSYTLIMSGSSKAGSFPDATGFRDIILEKAKERNRLPNTSI
jgi:hypothetical protein